MIDYGRLDRSIKYYEEYSFKRIESPWTVTRAVSDITKPAGKGDWEILGKNKVLVASGEQSFLYLYLKGFIPKGKYQTVTPCFRDEPFDQTHTKYFIKNELIITDDVGESQLKGLVLRSLEFFEMELQVRPTVVETDIGIDIEVNGIEIGSYGIRQCEYLKWMYGTGLAEPRMSFVKESIENGISRK